jgi:hypothetical protein
MKDIKQILFFAAISSIVISCSTKKDTVINRNYHALTTKYNILFNGKEAFKKGIEEINSNYQDNYWKQLPIEPIAFDEDKVVVPTFSPNANSGNSEKEEKKELTTFDKAEDKAVKAIQKHEMKIDGLERNRQIDDAYLLLGKSRYYSQRFIPAIEAFNYVIANYPNANLIAETKIWRAKANIRIDNEERAIESMNLLLVVRDSLEANLPDEIKEQGHTAMAMAYVKLDSVDKVKEHLLKATRTFKNREQSARNLFILGQIYSQENKKDSAVLVFDKLSKFKKAPKKYKIHANIELAKNFSKDSSSEALIERMQKLIKDRDNRPYLDELFYQVGVLHEDNDSIHLAVTNYNNSLRANLGSDQQKTYTYEKLGNLYFKNAAYQLASSYYDSVLSTAKDQNELRIRRVKRKHKNLASLINFEKVITENDSILRIASLSKEAQTTYFQNYIAKIKKEDEEKAQQQLNQLAFANATGNSLQSNNQGKWYFYNTQSLSFGKTEFKRIWGDRALEDNWRWSSTISNNTNTTDSTTASTINLRYDLASYLQKIPSEKSAIDSLKLDRNQALYESGVLYKEQFKNPQIAIQRLERVASLNPEEKLVLPINWHLYQLYTSLNDAKANKNKDRILSDYPATTFAKIILNPASNLATEVAIDEVENSYKEMYYLYKENKFEVMVTKIDEIVAAIPESKFIPKFELLKAYAIGKYKDKTAYKEAMEYVAVSFGNTEEGKKAKEIVEQLNK